MELESRITKMPLRYVENFAEFVDFPVNKMILTGEPEAVLKGQELMREKFGDQLNIFRSEPFYLEDDATVY